MFSETCIEDFTSKKSNFFIITSPTVKNINQYYISNRSSVRLLLLFIIQKLPRIFWADWLYQFSEGRRFHTDRTRCSPTLSLPLPLCLNTQPCFPLFCLLKAGCFWFWKCRESKCSADSPQHSSGRRCREHHLFC